MASDLRYSDGIAGARTMIALECNAAALQRRLPSGWGVAPYAGADLRGTSLPGANLLVPVHEGYAVRTHDGRLAGLSQVSYIAFVSQARNQAMGELAHFHWFLYTEDPAGVPGKYGDGKLAHITQSQTFTKERRGETQVREAFSAVADGGEVHLSLAYEQGGIVNWATAVQQFAGSRFCSRKAHVRMQKAPQREFFLCQILREVLRQAAVRAQVEVWRATAKFQSV